MLGPMSHEDPEPEDAGVRGQPVGGGRSGHAEVCTTPGHGFSPRRRLS